MQVVPALVHLFKHVITLLCATLTPQLAQQLCLRHVLYCLRDTHSHVST